MANDNKKYYWIKLKEDFFQSYKMRALESMENGMLYELIYLKLLTESITHNGELRFSKTIPYSPKILAGVLNVDIDNLKGAIQAFKELELIEELDDGTLFMQEINKLVGSETEWAEKKRIYREKQELLKCDENVNNNSENINNNTENIEENTENVIKEDIKETKKDIERTKKDNVRQENRDKSIENRDKSSSTSSTASILEQYIPNVNQSYFDVIRDYENMPFELFEYAIKETGSSDRPSARYFRSILERLKNDGITKLSQIKPKPKSIKVNKNKLKKTYEREIIDYDAELNERAKNGIDIFK